MESLLHCYPFTYNNGVIMKALIVFFLSCLISSLSFSAPELKGGPEDLRRFLHPKDRLVTISANAEEKAYSDRAVVSLVISTEESLLSEAIAKNSELRAGITKQLISVNIAADKIKSSKFSTSPQYGWFGSKPSSYKVVNRMAVTITQESQLKEIAAVADGSDEISISDTSFEHSKKDEFKQKVKQKALDKVLRQKDFYEKSLGVKLTPVNFREGRVALNATRGAAVLEEVIVTAAKSSARRSVADAPAYRAAAREEASFDEVKYETDLYVDFKIETK